MTGLTQAMIFGAGLGTRLRPITDTIPKALIPLKGKPLLGHMLDKMAQNGIRHLVINVHHHSDQIIRYLRQVSYPELTIQVSDESDQLLDTGGGLRKAMPMFDLTQPILLHNVDVITNLDLQAFGRYHLESQNLATLFVQQRKSHRYLLMDKHMLLCGRVNLITGEITITRQGEEPIVQYAFNGVHVVSPEIFIRMPDQGVFSLTDFYLAISDEHPIGGYCDNQATYLDVGKPDTLAIADEQL